MDWDLKTLTVGIKETGGEKAGAVYNLRNLLAKPSLLNKFLHDFYVQDVGPFRIFELKTDHSPTQLVDRFEDEFRVRMLPRNYDLNVAQFSATEAQARSLTEALRTGIERYTRL